MKTNLSIQIKKLRTDQGLKVKEIVAATNIDQALISKFENGSRIPTDAQVIALSKCFNVSFSELKKYQLTEMIYSMLENEDLGYEALKAAEPRLEYISKRKLEEQLKTSQLIKDALTEVDILKRELSTLTKSNQNHISKIDEHFSLQYTYESNKIEGNTLTLSETMMVIKEGITISGKSVSEHLEAINHSEAVELLYDLVNRKVSFSEYTMLQLHSLILRGIDRLNAGRYRSLNVRILGAEHIPPEPYLVPKLMEEYFEFYNQGYQSLHPIILAAEMHERLVTIHPFIDGNGRTSRLVMNLILMMHGYPFAILKGDQTSRLKYFSSLESVQIDGDPEPFYSLVISSVSNTLKERINLLK